jgi:hypothetical protein
LRRDVVIGSTLISVLEAAASRGERNVFPAVVAGVIRQTPEADVARSPPEVFGVGDRATER